MYYACGIALIMLGRRTKKSKKLYHSYKTTTEVRHALLIFLMYMFLNSL